MVLIPFLKTSLALVRLGKISLIYYACKQRTDPVYTFHTARRRMVPPQYYYGAQCPIVF